MHRKGLPGEDDDEPLAHELRCFPNSGQAAQLRVVALTVAAKFTADPLRARAAATRARAAADPIAELASRRSSGAGAGDLPPQALPASMPSLEYRLQWHARGGSGAVSVWRPVAPPGYAPLGDVATLGREPPPQPVQVLRILRMTNAIAGVFDILRCLCVLSGQRCLCVLSGQRCAVPQAEPACADIPGAFRLCSIADT